MIVIVGQAPGPSSNRREPLTGASGRRLASLCGMTADEFCSRFERVNLLARYPGKLGKGDAFDLAAGRSAAFRLLPRMVGRRSVLLGGKVAASFGLRAAPMFAWRRIGGAVVAVAPHPSGISHWWNDPRNVRRARRFWRRLARCG
jgi:uracil-DNA glycosylase